MSIRPNPFWEFSILLFADRQVAEACITIQDRHVAVADVDVNLLLLCTWAAANGAGALDNAQINRAMAVVGPWRRDVVLPLRTARRTLERGVEPVPHQYTQTVRSEVLGAEMEAESIEQMMLVELIGRPSRAVTAAQATADAATSFARYFALLRLQATPEDDRDLAQILAAAFPDRRARREPSGE